jgi:hypothetical protein
MPYDELAQQTRIQGSFILHRDDGFYDAYLFQYLQSHAKIFHAVIFATTFSAIRVARNAVGREIMKAMP